MMKWVRRILVAVFMIYAAIAAAAFFAQRSFLYFPPDYYHAPPAGFSEIKTESGILGWYSPAKNSRPTVMIFHGNGSSIDSNLHIFRDLQAAGYGVWAAGYPGYPGNSGKPSQDKIMDAAREQYETLRAKGVTDIIFYGTSLGSGVASQLSAHHAPELLILDAPFNSMSDMAKLHVKLLPTGLLLRDKWKSDQALQSAEIPLIWIHGTADSIIDISQGQKLYDGYSGPKTAHIIPGAHHTNTWLLGGRDIVLSALDKL